MFEDATAGGMQGNAAAAQAIEVMTRLGASETEQILGTASKKERKQIKAETPKPPPDPSISSPIPHNKISLTHR